MLEQIIEKSNLNVKNQFIKTRSLTEQLCQPLTIEEYTVQPAIFASPPKWHLAHTTWFFEEFILKDFSTNYQVYDEDYSFLFNSYYNNVGKRTFRANRGNITRPGVKEVYAYRVAITTAITELLKHSCSKDVLKLIVLGIHHEQQHQELLITDFKYTLGHNPIFPVYQNDFSLANIENDSSGYAIIKEGIYTIGYQGDGFCYDNELGIHKIYLHKFEIANLLVTNEEFIAFIEDGGYSNFNLWLDAGWSWVQEHKIEAPLYWHKIKGKWYNYTLSGLEKINPKAQLCHVSFYEAAAFAEWKNMRLPTEFEWEIASDKLAWGSRWEWTNSAYLPYPGFDKAPGAVGEYNGKFMINQMVLRGASVATSDSHSRKTYRNFFHPNERWQFTGIRLVKK